MVHDSSKFQLICSRIIILLYHVSCTDGQNMNDWFAPATSEKWHHTANSPSSLCTRSVYPHLLCVPGKPMAWVTLATTDAYALGALVLAHSLRQAGTAHRLVVMITPGVTDTMRSVRGHGTQLFDADRAVQVRVVMCLLWVFAWDPVPWMPWSLRYGSLGIVLYKMCMPISFSFCCAEQNKCLSMSRQTGEQLLFSWSGNFPPFSDFPAVDWGIEGCRLRFWYHPSLAALVPDYVKV